MGTFLQLRALFYFYWERERDSFGDNIIMNEIRRLDKSAVEDIRSTFTIYNQAQALEEVVLNSVDAQATTIEVHISPSIFSFEVRDNGHGMSREDLELCGERYG